MELIRLYVENITAECEVCISTDGEIIFAAFKREVSITFVKRIELDNNVAT